MLRNEILKKLFILLFLIIGPAATGFGSYVMVEELWLQNTTGGTIERSIWFVHPTDDYPSIALVRDRYAATNNEEEFSLVVHGIGNLSLTDRGAKWSRENNQNDGVQVEIFADLSEKEVLQGYNAEFRTMQPYLKATLEQKGEVEYVWLAVATDNNETIPVVYQNKQIIVNNSLIMSVPNDESDKLEIDPYFGSGSSFEFYGDIFIESNGSKPFQMGANIINTTKLGYVPDDLSTIPTESFEISNGKNVEIEKNTIEWEESLDRNIVNVLSDTQIESALAQLPDDGPFLYVNNSELVDIQSKMNPIPNTVEYIMASSINSSASNAMQFDETDPSLSALKTRASHAMYLGFHAWVSQNTTEATKVYNILKDMTDHIDRIEEDPKMLNHGIYLASYTLAWDFVQRLLTSEQDHEIAAAIETYGEFVLDFLPDCLDNNWELVVSSGTGMAGLKLHNTEMVKATLEKLDHYITDNVRLEGGIYEGQGYIGYAFSSFKRFLMSCSLWQSLGLPNYFKDRRLQSVYRFAARCATPDGYYPLFEDANPSTSGARNGFILAPFFKNAGEEELAGELVWLYNFHDVNSTRDNIENLLFANYSLPSKEPVLPEKSGFEAGDDPYLGASYVAQDSGLAMFRSSWETNASFLATTAKEYDQSHTHLDEFTFEFWANGSKLLANPGYPGWGKEHHDYTITTEAHNGAVLFSGKGQSHSVCDTGIVQWLRGNHIDYIQLYDESIYGPWHNSLIPMEYFWAVQVGLGVGLAMIVIDVILLKKR